MQTTNSDTVIATIKQCLTLRAPNRIAPGTDIDGDQNLLELIDSFGFVELIVELEDKLGIEIDLSEIDLSEIVHFKNLTKFVSQQNWQTIASQELHSVTLQ
ncbi:MAG: phosphopantetheine-binding protein [Thiotrichaceae bacterium]